jgi:hypothetical protein
MISAHVLVVASNSHAARFFLRKRAEGLHELVERAECADFLDMHGKRVDQFEKRGGRTMVKAHARCEDAEMEIFLSRVAAEVDDALNENAEAALALIAPALVLRKLRDMISVASRSKLILERCEDVVCASLKDIAAIAATPTR